MSGTVDPVDRRSPERRARWALLGRLNRLLEPVLVLLSVVWVGLLVAELVNDGLPPMLAALVWVIWAIFVLDFILELAIAPDRPAYLRRSWVTALSLILPAFRILRLARALRVLRGARFVRSIGLLRIATTVNRGLGALGRTARRRGAGYVAAATVLVIVVGAAGMASLESPGALSDEGVQVAPGAGIADYGEALWWTASTMTTGPTEEPRTPEGRLLGWLLSVYGLVVFGYLTAILASHFVGRDQLETRDGDRSA